ncbi:MAG: hypothetical protein AAF569_06270 [Pseudomonadota bacterium]
MKRLSLLIFILLIAGCAGGLNPAQFAGKDAQYDDFNLCHGYGCLTTTRIGLTDKQWKTVTKNFKRPAKTAEEERSKIAKAAAQFEKYTSKISALPKDKAEARSLPEDEGQMDCVDETINMAQFLEFLDAEDVLKFHVAAKPMQRGFFIDGKWPHNTAAIREIATGQIYAVDGFYRAAGKPPYIIERNIWMANWRPSQSE